MNFGECRDGGCSGIESLHYMSSFFATRLLPLFACLSAACAKAPAAPAPPGEAAPPTKAVASSAVPVLPPETADSWSAPHTCADKSCFAFDDDASALRALLAKTKPSAIGFGEAHTPAEFTARTTVRRFTDDLLQVLAPETSALFVELLAPASGCDGAKQAVKREADAVTAGQAEGNQNEYAKLGKRARELGVVPDILRASCDDLKSIQAAGELGVVTMMETIARLTGAAVVERRTRLLPGRPLVLAYGGALHNDARPRVGRETWSYGPGLTQATDGAYLEIDLVLRALVTDSAAWQSFGWYAAFRSLDAASPKAWLIQNGASSYAFVFAPETAQSK